jgi:hypothetical protein
MGTCEYCCQYDLGYCNYHLLPVNADDTICSAMIENIENSTFGENMSYDGKDR